MLIALLDTEKTSWMEIQEGLMGSNIMLLIYHFPLNVIRD
jgi:hypothetical protein